MKVLITGGAGYIGSILTPTLLREGFQVTVIDSLMYHQNSLLDVCADPGFSFVRGDVRDHQHLQALATKHDIIIPLAAIVGAPACDNDPLLARQVNFEAIKTLLEVISAQQMVLYPVTNSGYGIGQKDRFCDEKTPLNPISLYGKTKVDAEKLLLDTGMAATFRLATVFGTSPRMRLDLLVNDFVHRAVTDRSIVLFESQFKRNYIHIRDVADVFLFGIQNFEKMKGEAFNVGLSDANLSKMELCLKIKEHILDFHILESEIGKDPDKRDYIVSNEKIEDAGFRPGHSLDTGIAELIKGYQILRTNPFCNI
jgi:nucleoside-diphosphate-sugar epimerase